MALNVHVIECNVDPSSAPDAVGQHWINTVTCCHFLSCGTSSVSDWKKIAVDNTLTVTVSASSTVNLHTTALSDLCATHYKICMFNETEDKWRSLQLFGSKKTSTTLEDSIYTILGENLNIDLNYKVVSTDAVLEAVNNEAFDITVKLSIETF